VLHRQSRQTVFYIVYGNMKEEEKQSKRSCIEKKLSLEYFKPWLRHSVHEKNMRVYR
jgi:hypothetical protein